MLLSSRAMQIFWGCFFWVLPQLSQPARPLPQKLEVMEASMRWAYA